MRGVTAVSAVSVLIAVASAAIPAHTPSYLAVLRQLGPGTWPSGHQVHKTAPETSSTHIGSAPGQHTSVQLARQAADTAALHDRREPQDGSTLHQQTSQPTVRSKPGSTAEIPCVGDGTTGPRVQVLLVGSKEQLDEVSTSAHSTAHADATAATARAADVFARSAQHRGGQQKLRLVTQSCELVLEQVAMPEATMETFAGMRTELLQRGYNRTDRAYLVFAIPTHYCGVAAMKRDDSAGPGNVNNQGPVFARVDRNCWGLPHSVEAHELVHAFGGVQPGAPGATQDGHATDVGDRLAASGGTACHDEVGPLLDCSGTSYFHPNPPAGSYLATHWNVADSAFLNEPTVAR